MKTKYQQRHIGWVRAFVLGGCWLAAASVASAHCDTEKGPVIQEARMALEKGDVTPLLKWVKKDQEAEIKSVFAAATAVRAKGPDAKALADRHFIETLVRVHRAAEGATFSGIKDEPVDPVIAMAESSLVNGTPDKMIGEVTDHMASAIKKRFDLVVETSKHKNDSVEAGRAFVQAYVGYMHFVENLHAAIATQDQHHATPEPMGEDGHVHGEE